MRSRSESDDHLIFLGSQTSFFFFTTAAQSLHRKRPGFGLAVDLPSLHFIWTEIISHPAPTTRESPVAPKPARCSGDWSGFKRIPIRKLRRGQRSSRCGNERFFCKIKEGKDFRGGVLGYTAQGNPPPDAEIAEKRRFRTRTGYTLRAAEDIEHADPRVVHRKRPDGPRRSGD